MNPAFFDPNLALQFLVSLLWVLVCAVAIPFLVELVCVVALWVFDGNRENKLRATRAKGREASVPGSGQ